MSIRPWTLAGTMVCSLSMEFVETLLDDSTPKSFTNLFCINYKHNYGQVFVISHLLDKRYVLLRCRINVQDLEWFEIKHANYSQNEHLYDANNLFMIFKR